MGKFSITDIRKARASTEQRRRRLRRLMMWGGGTALLLVALFLFVLPPVLRSQLEKRLSAELDRTVLIGSVSVNPFKGALTITDFHVITKDEEGGDLFGWSRLYVNANLTSLVFGDIRFDEIDVAGISGQVIVAENGKLSFSDIVERHVPKAAAQAGVKTDAKPSSLSLIVDRLKVSGAKLRFVDRSHGQEFSTEVGPLTFALKDFELHPERRAPYEFEASTEAGERLIWRGTVGVAPFRSSGELSLGGIQLPKYAPYYKDLINFKLLSGRLDMQGAYEMVLKEEGPALVLRNGMVKLSSLGVAKPGATQPVLGISELTVSGIDADTAAARAIVGQISLKGGQVSAIRARDGSIDLQHLFSPKTASASAGPVISPAPASAPSSPDVAALWIQNSRVERLLVEGIQARLLDETTPRAAQLTVNDITATLEGVSLAKGAEIAVSVSAKPGDGGPVSVSGEAGLSPLHAELDWSVEGMALAQFSPYLEQGVRARFVQGALSTKGHLSFSLSDKDGLSANARCGLGVAQLALVDETYGESLAGLEALSVTGIDFKLHEKSLVVEDVLIKGPSVSLLLGKDGVPNVAGLLREQPKQASAAQEPALTLSVPSSSSTPVAGPANASGLPLEISIGKIVLSGASASFHDQSLKPEVRFSVRDFGGQIIGLTTKAGNPAKVTLGGNLEGSGRLMFEGVLYPFGKQAATDLKVGVEGLNLVAFSPYSGKFAGYALSGGRFNLDVKVHLADRALDSENVMTLDHFTFGAASNSPEATKLPVRLAVSLLKDRHGKILIDVPVKGSLDDPEFKVGRVVWQVVGNLLTKAATSPFTLLGAAFGGGDELAFMEFKAGSNELDASSTAKLQKLQQALVDRPGVGLTLVGNFDQQLDVAAMRTRMLNQLVSRAVWQARRAANPDASTVEQSPVSELERIQTLRAMYVAKHGPIAIPAAEFLASNPSVDGAAVPNTQATGKPASGEGSAAAKDADANKELGFFARVYAFITGQRKPTGAAPGSLYSKNGQKRPAASGQVADKPAQGVPAVEIVLPVVSVAEQVRVLETDIEVPESDLIRLGLDRAEAVERRLVEAGVDASRLNVTSPAVGTARVELQIN